MHLHSSPLLIWLPAAVMYLWRIAASLMSRACQSSVSYWALLSWLIAVMIRLKVFFLISSVMSR